MSVERKTTKASTRWAIAAALSWPALLSLALLGLVVIVLFSTAGPATIPPSAAGSGTVACTDATTEAAGSSQRPAFAESHEHTAARRPSVGTGAADAGSEFSPPAITCGRDSHGAATEFDPGNIISDDVFYDNLAFADVAAVQAALDRIGGTCVASTCLRRSTYTPGAYHLAWCKDWAGPTRPQSYASILFHLGKSCGINPQVAIVIVQKESQGLTRPTPPAALTGFGCPDTGPGGSANCDPGSTGVWAQTLGMFQAFARLRDDSSKVNYLEGRASNILWNVAETGCGSAPVEVKNRATATLYTYTPSPTPLTPVKGTPAAPTATATSSGCSPGTSAAPAAAHRRAWRSPRTDPASPSPTTLTSQLELAGRTIKAPNSAVAKGLAAGFGALGLPYVWGGGGSGAARTTAAPEAAATTTPADPEVGFDCSGLTAFVLAKPGTTYRGTPANNAPVASRSPGSTAYQVTSSGSQVTSRSTSAPSKAGGTSWRHRGSARPSTSFRSPGLITTTDFTAIGAVPVVNDFGLRSSECSAVRWFWL